MFPTDEYIELCEKRFLFGALQGHPSLLTVEEDEETTKPEEEATISD